MAPVVAFACPDLAWGGNVARLDHLLKKVARSSELASGFIRRWGGETSPYTILAGAFKMMGKYGGIRK